MANVDRPCGFTPKGEPLRVNPYVAGSTIYPGDMIMAPAADGQVDPSVGGAAELLIGAALTYATVGQEVLVSDHPAQLYIVQADAAEVDNANDVGDYFEVKATTGDTTYKVSRQEVDTMGTTATLPLRFVAIEAGSGNAVANGNNLKVIVAINTYAFQS